MDNRIATANTRTLPMLLVYTNIRSYIFTLSFVLLGVLVPWVCHHFHLAGPTFLPMHIFVLAGGLLFGWRAGLIIGLLSPLTSYAMSGMPGLTILSQTTVELSAYGFIAGVLREKFHLRVPWSLLSAMAGGRLALLLAAVVLYLTVGESHSPFGPVANPFLVLWSVVRYGWPGIIIQIALIPLAIPLVEKWLARSRL